jgi:hypothetical protein
MAYVITRSKGPMRYARRTSNGTSSTHSWQSPGHATWCTAFYLAPMRRRRELDPPAGSGRGAGGDRAASGRDRGFVRLPPFAPILVTWPRSGAARRGIDASAASIASWLRPTASQSGPRSGAPVAAPMMPAHGGRAGVGLAMPDQDANHLQLCGGATSDAAGHDRGGITMIGRFRG